MRGEFIGVWCDTWREIWSELAAHEEAPTDLFCELYRELADVLTPPSPEDALSLVIGDEILIKEAFDKALLSAGLDLAVEQRQAAYDLAIGGGEGGAPIARSDAIEAALTAVINDSTRSAIAWKTALADLVNDPDKIAEVRERALANTINDPIGSREAFKAIRAENIAGERALVGFLEQVQSVLDEMRGDSLANRYFGLLTAFIEKFSLRYDLRRPCTLCPTLPGMFSRLVGDLRKLAGKDAHLDNLMKAFEDAIRDLRTDCSDSRIKTCMQKQMNLLEAIGRVFPGVKGTTLGAICNEVGTWPHEKMKEAMKNLYGFASDYPGIRHGGTPGSAIRSIDMRDMVAMSIVLAGFTPYLTNQLDADIVYRGT